MTQISVNGGKYVSAIALEDSDDVLITFNKEGYAYKSHYITSTDEEFTCPAKIDVNNVIKLETQKDEPDIFDQKETNDQPLVLTNEIQEDKKRKEIKTVRL